MKIFIINKQKKAAVDKELRNMIKNVVIKAAEIENLKIPFEVCIVLTGNIGIRKLNRQFRSMDKPTDVLSFPMYEETELKGILKSNEILDMIALGDIVISLEKAQEQAKEYGHSFERETAYLASHGFLHLLGYDHISQKEKELMRQKEEQIMELLNLKRE
ncbi:MAG: rRNA maturation RNase YbeY [Ignavibacteriales bacterium]